MRGIHMISSASRYVVEVVPSNVDRHAGGGADQPRRIRGLGGYVLLDKLTYTVP